MAGTSYFIADRGARSLAAAMDATTDDDNILLSLPADILFNIALSSSINYRAGLSSRWSTLCRLLATSRGLRASLLRSLRSTQNLSITGDDITFGVAELLATLPLRSLSVRFEEGGWRGEPYSETMLKLEWAELREAQSIVLLDKRTFVDSDRPGRQPIDHELDARENARMSLWLGERYRPQFIEMSGYPHESLVIARLVAPLLRRGIGKTLKSLSIWTSYPHQIVNLDVLTRGGQRSARWSELIETEPQVDTPQDGFAAILMAGVLPEHTALRMIRVDLTGLPSAVGTALAHAEYRFDRRIFLDAVNLHTRAAERFGRAMESSCLHPTPMALSRLKACRIKYEIPALYASYASASRGLLMDFAGLWRDLFMAPSALNRQYLEDRAEQRAIRQYRNGLRNSFHPDPTPWWRKDRRWLPMFFLILLIVIFMVFMRYVEHLQAKANGWPSPKIGPSFLSPSYANDLSGGLRAAMIESHAAKAEEVKEAAPPPLMIDLTERAEAAVDEREL